jgi:hypothetical protein
MIKLYTILRIVNRGIWPGGAMVQGREVMIFGIRHGRQKNVFIPQISLLHLQIFSHDNPENYRLPFRILKRILGGSSKADPPSLLQGLLQKPAGAIRSPILIIAPTLSGAMGSILPDSEHIQGLHQGR